MKKKRFTKSSKQILATIGFVIAILWTVKFFIQAGSSGYNEIKNKTTEKSSTNSSSVEKYPILKCTVIHDGDRIVKVHDLNIEKTNRVIGTNYIEWRTATASDKGEPVIMDHMTDRRSGSYTLKYENLISGGKYTFYGSCEAGSNKKIF